jgi:hypothetical protein
MHVRLIEGFVVNIYYTERETMLVANKIILLQDYIVLYPSMYNVFCFRNSTLLIHFFLPLSPWIGSLIWVMLVLIAISDWHLLQKKKS